MMPVRWLSNRSRTRCSACRSSRSAVFIATNFIVRPLHSLGDRLRITYFAGISRAS